MSYVQCFWFTCHLTKLKENESYLMSLIFQPCTHFHNPLWCFLIISFFHYKINSLVLKWLLLSHFNNTFLSHCPPQKTCPTNQIIFLTSNAYSSVFTSIKCFCPDVSFLHYDSLCFFLFFPSVSYCHRQFLLVSRFPSQTEVKVT